MKIADSNRHWRIEILSREGGWIPTDTVFAEWRDVFTEMSDLRTLFPSFVFRIRGVVNEEDVGSMAVNATAYCTSN